MLRISEIYESVQGEGPRVGTPTLFVRFAGCNLRCPGWPCDSPYAIFPDQYRTEWWKYTAEELADVIHEKTVPGQNVCLTGGEPFLQPFDDLAHIINMLTISERKFECFSNGTFDIPPQFFYDIAFVFDWKLPGSGETLSSMNADNFISNLHRARDVSALNRGAPGCAIKFTVTGFDDFHEAVERWDKIKDEIPWPVFVGPVWGKCEAEQVAEWLLECDLPWRLNIQTHKYIYGDIRGI